MSGNQNQGQKSGNPMKPSDSARIQSGQAKGGKDMSSGGFAAAAQSAGAKNENTGYSSYGHQGNNDGVLYSSCGQRISGAGKDVGRGGQDSD
ncbi:hypothetical protein GGS20DRAFT_590620 [Poronia punctata]|nr:hypothetical protein GGS20DRAFT_590620 [Poronia punctata]